MKSSGGLSLLEAVIATFLLLASFLVIVNLFHQGLKYSVRIENQQLAAMVAERQLEQMRSWSEKGSAGVYNFDTLISVYNGTSSVPTDYSQFTVTTSVVNSLLYSPSTTLEKGLATSPTVVTREIQNSARKVDVRVVWGSNQVAVTSLFSRPTTDFAASNPIQVTLVGSATLPLGQDLSADFKAQARDTNNQPVTDLTYQWEIVPVSGNGTLVQTRSGSLATLTNAVNVAGEIYHTGGSLYLRASARNHGRMTEGLSPLILLQ